MPSGRWGSTMKTLTQDDYGRRKLDLSRAIELAEGDVHSAAFKETTGTGKPADTKAAKDHLATLRDQLSDLESAWLGTQAARKVEREQQARDGFETYLNGVRDQLKVRKEAVEAMPAIIAELRKNVTAYREATEAIRLMARPFFGNADHSYSFERQSQLNNSLSSDFNYVERQLGQFANEMSVSIVADWRTMFRDKTPGELEDKVAERVLIAAKAFAPKCETAG